MLANRSGVTLTVIAGPTRGRPPDLFFLAGGSGVIFVAQV